MLRWFLAISLIASTLSCAPRSMSSDAHVRPDPLHGVWHLLRYETWDSAGQSRMPFGDPPAGYAVFTPEGMAFIQMMRVASRSNGSIQGDPSQYISYFGPYSIDASGTSFGVRVEGTNTLSYLGSEQRRPFRISEDTLFLGIPGQYQATLRRVRPAKPISQ